LHRVVGFTRWTVLAAALAALAGAVVWFAARRTAEEPDRIAHLPVATYLIAAVLALVPALALLPKLSADAVTLPGPICDHAKVAMIDDIVRLGVPPGNPFFAEAGHDAPLAYYYLWHFSAAELAVLCGVSGWEADIALTGFTAYASLLLMAGCAVWFAG